MERRCRVRFTPFVMVALAATGLLCCRPRSSNPAVTNGVIHETAALDLSDSAVVVIPETASVEEGPQNGRVEIKLEKVLAFRGHPPHPIHIERAHGYFGAAYKRESRTLILGTYGEWSSMEGGASIRMLVVVPKKTTVLRRPRLSGETSEAMPTDMSSWSDRLDSSEFGECYWYTAVSPAEGWTKVEGDDVHVSIDESE